MPIPHVPLTQASHHFPVHHTHRQDVVYQSKVVEKARQPRGQGKGTHKLNKQGSGWGNGKQRRHCHHQVMWGRVKELFRHRTFGQPGLNKISARDRIAHPLR